MLGKVLEPILGSERPRGRITIRQSDISTMVFRAVPTIGADLNATESVVILIGLTSVLSSIGFQRKSAFVLKQMLSFLIPSLVQARKVGAAEMGIHPAAGLSMITAVGSASPGDSVGNGQLEVGLRAL